ncbi:MAG: hypothetical protein AB1763_04495 [Campylobacterota bacterium]
MKTLFASLIAAGYLYGAGGETQSILGDVAKLRQKYEECRQSQEANPKIKGYQTRIARLEAQIKENAEQLKSLQQRNREIEQEIGRKKGVIQSLEKTLTSRDEQLRSVAARSERLAKEANAVKVGKIERENLTKALAKAKEQVRLLENDLKKSSAASLRKEAADARVEIARLRKELAAAHTAAKPATPAVSAAESQQVQALRRELEKANAAIQRLQSAPVREKVVTKVVEPTDKLASLQRELSAARAEIANLKASKPVTSPSVKVVEKVVYRDRPVEKIVTKTVQPTEQIKALQTELASAKTTIEKLKKAPATKEKVVEKVVYKDRIVTQEKVVYKDRPVEKIVTRTAETPQQVKALQSRLVQAEAQIAKLKNDLSAAQSRKTSVAAVPVRDARPVARSVSPEPAKAAAPAPKKGGSSAYRMASNAPIYNAPGGSVVDTWEARRSFTAGSPSGGWVHITGYFVNRVWQPTRPDENLWVRESDVIRR